MIRKLAFTVEIFNLAFINVWRHGQHTQARGFDGDGSSDDDRADIPGLRFTDPRVQALLHALLAFKVLPRGLARLIMGLSGWHNPAVHAHLRLQGGLGTHLHGRYTLGHQMATASRRADGGSQQKASSQPCKPKQSRAANLRPTHCDA
ncbi:hypothetical protein [Streptomyces guryensis]|uniref:hypothetical protein n=1 Tax=Streptomyces guryensis TaxID=2886947 RepID=UPI001E412D49|nr:hypothetical protein [Streptomyces guryensis]